MSPSNPQNSIRPVREGCRWLPLAFALTMLFPCQGLAQSSSPKPKFLATNLKGFGIPFKINADNESFIEVQLYISTDQGKTWRFYGRQSTDKTDFPFEADGDGDYWFAIKTLNRNRQLIPEGKPSPELIIQVDSVLPELTFDVQADAAGRIECRWKADDKNLKADSVQIEYQPIGAAPDDWKSVPVNLTGMVRNGSYADQLAWWPDTTERSLNVRLTIADQAGNSIYKERRINIAPSPWRHRNQSTAQVGDSQNQNRFQSPPSPPPVTEGVNQQPPLPDPAQSIEATTQLPSESGITAQKPALAYQCENGVCVPQAAKTAASLETQGSELRVAGGTKQGHEPPQIGSEPGIAAPPNPNLYGPDPDRVAAQSLPQQTASDPTPRGLSWESEIERWNRQNQTTSSTVRSPPINPEITPQRNLRPENLQLPNRNPNQITKDGQLVIGESNTQFPNQYRGLPKQAQPIAPPEFLSGEEATNWIAPEASEAAQPPANTPLNQLPRAQKDVLDQGANNNAVSPVADKADFANKQLQNPYLQPMSSASYRNDDGSSSSVVEAESNFDASVQMIPSKRFRLNYAVDAIDPSGLARVDLWMTRDEGATWKTWGSDPDNQSPFPVEVDEEGKYGFRIVIHSRDGLTGRGPSSGDLPDIFVVVDTQAPLAQIVSVPYGRGPEAGRLIVNYRVSDPHLTLRPISLFYSTNPQGPWTPIEEGLRNDGRFVWKPTSNVPDRVFLRLDGIDRAGNKGAHGLTQAIDISGLVPRGTIQGVVPVGVQ